jgi:hypothetical protein
LEVVFSLWSVPRLYKETNLEFSFSQLQLRVGGWLRLVGRGIPTGMKAEESPLLGAVTKQRLVKTITN